MPSRFHSMSPTSAMQPSMAKTYETRGLDRTPETECPSQAAMTNNSFSDADPMTSLVHLMEPEDSPRHAAFAGGMCTREHSAVPLGRRTVHRRLLAQPSGTSLGSRASQGSHGVMTKVCEPAEQVMPVTGIGHPGVDGAYSTAGWTPLRFGAKAHHADVRPLVDH